MISVPVSTMPASNVSSIVNSWRALRLRATVCSSRMAWLLRDGDCGAYGPERTNAGPIRTGVRDAYPPTGCPTRRPSPARWCSYAYCRSLHITSFRSQEPYLMRGCACKSHGSGGGAHRRRRPRRRAPRAPCRASGPRRAGASAGTSTATSGSSPTSWIQRLSGVSQRAIVSLKRAALAGELLPLLDGALAERRLADQRRPLAVLQRAGDDLARRGAPAVDRGRRCSGPGSSRRHPARPRSTTWPPFASCSQKMTPESMNSLATDRAAVT